MSNSPIVLFTYKRLDVTRLVVNSLLSNPEAIDSHIIIYSDGPKNQSDEVEVNLVRNYLSLLSGFKTIDFVFRTNNYGLSRSFITGITETLECFESAIFMEDDNLVSPGFLKFMNATLQLYKYDERVCCISGYSYPLWPHQNTPYFVRGAETWSMATWRRSWQYFCSDGNLLMSKIIDKNLFSKFSRDGFGFFSMLQAQIDGKNDSWGVRWWSSAFVNDLYCLYPHLPLCVSIGYGVDSVHCTGGYSPIFRSPSELVDKIDILLLPRVVRQTFKTSFLIFFMNHFSLKLFSFLSRSRAFAYRLFSLPHRP